MKPNTLGVIGLGAIGGSVAWQAARAGVQRIIGFSTAAKDGVAAAKAGAVSEIAPDARRVAESADLVVLGAPPRAILGTLGELAGILAGRSVCCTDVASVKEPVVRLAEELDLRSSFAGSHPLAGSTRSGFDGARPDMFAGKVVYVSALTGGDNVAGEVADFWRRVLAAEPVMLDAAAHDDLVAWSSHLPQVVASALAVVLSRQGPKGVTYGTGALTTTRRAVCNVELWTEILLLNKDNVLRALDGMHAESTQLARVLEADDEEQVRGWLEAGRGWRERLDE